MNQHYTQCYYNIYNTITIWYLCHLKHLYWKCCGPFRCHICLLCDSDSKSYCYYSFITLNWNEEVQWTGWYRVTAEQPCHCCSPTILFFIKTWSIHTSVSEGRVHWLKQTLLLIDNRQTQWASLLWDNKFILLHINVSKKKEGVMLFEQY